MDEIIKALERAELVINGQQEQIEMLEGTLTDIRDWLIEEDSELHSSLARAIMTVIKLSRGEE
jgi:hypothetical protein